jgi:hypothetical protein
VTTPAELTLARPGADELHVPPATSLENAVVAPVQTVGPPESVPADVVPPTETFVVPVAEQPL